MRFAPIIACVVSAAAVLGGCAEAMPQCKRPATPSDIFIDVKGEDVTILIANMAGDCVVVFPNSLRVAQPGDRRGPWFVFIRVEDANGNVLTRNNITPLLPEGWWSSMVQDSDDAELSDLIELKPGEAKAKHVTIGDLLSGLDAVLPRGQPLRMQLWVQLPPYPAELYRGSSANGASALSSVFLRSIP